MTSGVFSAPLASSSTTSKPNFRQVGIKPTGSVLKGGGAHHHHHQQQNPHSIVEPQSKVSSIPSKFETVLHRDAPERNAFGNRTQRFGDSENELPGPGAYYTPPSLVRSTADCGSVSRLGYSTGFVSKTKRFNDRVRDVLPGPGAYQPAKTDRRLQNRKFGMSSFANMPKRSNNQTSAVSAPGPADYNTVQTSTALAHNIARAVFSSKTSRGFDPPRDGPAPGQYNNLTQLGQQPLHSRASPQSSVFKSTAKRLESSSTFSATPGPGAYNAEDAESALRYDWVSRAHASAAFHSSTVDRFGHLPGHRAADGDLGPGSYEVGSSLGDKRGSVTATVFKSTTTRDQRVGVQPSSDAPGPAFYHPTSPERRSHLLNANKKWL